MIATVVRAMGAPGPTLVVELSALPRGALALRAELAALRAALAPTPYARLNKIALYGRAGRPDRDLDYRFVQALPDGGFDFRTGCGHSLLACVKASGLPGAVSVRAVTTGDDVLCEPEEPPAGESPTEASGPASGSRAVTAAHAERPRRLVGRPLTRTDALLGEAGDREGPAAPAHTLHFLRAPGAPGTLPTGRPRDVLGSVPVSLVRYGNPYVFVDAAHLGIHSRDALFAAGGSTQRRLLALRAAAARVLGLPPHSALPKIAAFTGSGGRTAVRAVTVGGWHPSLALTGAAALAAAAALPGTVVPPADGTVDTPGGPVTLSAGPDRVSVHHKRAEILDRLDLPWRIHATA